jgi:hypothetical protein
MIFMAGRIPASGGARDPDSAATQVLQTGLYVPGAGHSVQLTKTARF